jgi:two-component system, NarL family, invasion response regulator UvrY
VTTRHPDKPVRVLTVDDHVPYLLVARRVVEATPGFSWAGGASTGPEALAAIDEAEPDLALVDINMPEIDGIELARLVRQTHPSVFVVLISAADQGELPAAARAPDATSVVRKEDLRPGLLRGLWQARHPN